jgi:hypothetical protein
VCSLLWSTVGMHNASESTTMAPQYVLEINNREFVFLIVISAQYNGRYCMRACRCHRCCSGLLTQKHSEAAFIFSTLCSAELHWSLSFSDNVSPSSGTQRSISRCNNKIRSTFGGVITQHSLICLSCSHRCTPTLDVA